MAESKVAQNGMDKLSLAINSFGLKLHLLLTKETANVFFSPFSISMALSMLYRGARNETAAELAQALQFKHVQLTEKDVHSGFEHLFSEFLESQDAYVLAIANAIVSEKDFALLPEYKFELKKSYRALLMEVDFLRESITAVTKINDWVKENTKGKIQKVFDSLDPATVIVLLNAVYFKGTWLNQFHKSATYDGVFYNHGMVNLPKKVPLMTLEEEFFFVEKNNFKVLELPYVGDDIAMLLLLPSKRDSLSTLESSLTQDFVNTIQKELFKVNVCVTIPKLHLEFSKELKPILMKLGINAAFDCSANFKGLSESDQLEVSQVVHKAVLDVNEEGSEAAAVTAIAIVDCCGFLDDPVEFTADHPFLFMIYDKKNSLILFMGRVEEF